MDGIELPLLLELWSQLDNKTRSRTSRIAMTDFKIHQVTSKARERTWSKYVYLQGHFYSCSFSLAYLSYLRVRDFHQIRKDNAFCVRDQCPWTTRWAIKYSPSSTTMYAPRLSLDSSCLTDMRVAARIPYIGHSVPPNRRRPYQRLSSFEGVYWVFSWFLLKECVNANDRLRSRVWRFRRLSISRCILSGGYTHVIFLVHSRLCSHLLGVYSNPRLDLLSSP